MGWGESLPSPDEPGVVDWRAGSEAGFRSLAADVRLDRTGSPSHSQQGEGRWPLGADFSPHQCARACERHDDTEDVKELNSVCYL